MTEHAARDQLDDRCTTARRDRSTDSPTRQVTRARDRTTTTMLDLGRLLAEHLDLVDLLVVEQAERDHDHDHEDERREHDLAARGSIDRSIDSIDRIRNRTERSRAISRDTREGARARERRQSRSRDERRAEGWNGYSDKSQKPRREGEWKTTRQCAFVADNRLSETTLAICRTPTAKAPRNAVAPNRGPPNREARAPVETKAPVMCVSSRTAKGEEVTRRASGRSTASRRRSDRTTRLPRRRPCASRAAKNGGGAMMYDTTTTTTEQRACQKTVMFIPPQPARSPHSYEHSSAPALLPTSIGRPRMTTWRRHEPIATTWRRRARARRVSAAAKENAPFPLT